MKQSFRAGWGITQGAVFGAVFGAAIGAALLAATPARAEDDELPDTKVFNYVLKSLGLGPSATIEYRERSPLVVPPKRDLPPPESDVAGAAPNWPVEPDVKRSRENKAVARRTGGVSPDKDMESSRPLRPDELNVGSRTNSARDGTAMDPERSAQQLKPSELGDRDMFSRLFGSRSNGEAVRFTGEAPRGNLTEPPTGYQTPSPNQPYGVVGKEKVQPKAANSYYDHPVGDY